jgi:hypothetical protein
MKTVHDYLNKDENEFVQLVWFLKNKYKQAESNGVYIQEELKKVMLSTDKMVKDVLNNADRRMKADKKNEEKKKNETFPVDCPQCDSSQERKPTGTAMNNGYRCRSFTCDECGQNWVDYYPIDEDELLAWMKNFVEKISEPERKKRLEIPDKTINKARRMYTDLSKIMLEAKEAEQKEKESSGVLNKNICGMRDLLLKIKSRHFPDVPLNGN